MRVLLADDQSKVRSALRLLLEQQFDLNVLGEAVDAQGLRDWVSAVCPDVVLLDWELPGLGANGLLPTLRQLSALEGDRPQRASGGTWGSSSRRGRRLRQQERLARTIAGGCARLLAQIAQQINSTKGG
jgi:CheY-like chemotaxis protein